MNPPLTPDLDSTIIVRGRAWRVAEVSPSNPSAGLLGLVGPKGRSVTASYSSQRPGCLLAGKLGQGWLAWAAQA